MPFDPAKPANGSPLSAAEMRAQLNALHAENTALAATVASQASTIATQNAAIVSLEARVTALENLPVGGITQAQLDAAIATTARNPDSVSPPSTAASDPPTQGEVQGGFDFSANLHTALLRT